MGQAKYNVMIPTVDNLGNKLVDIAGAAHTFLFYQGMADGSWIETGQRGHWRDDEPEPHETLVTIQEDTPEMDGVIKQLAVHIAEVANQWGIHVYKEGKNGIKSWVINNSHYREGEPAEAIAQQAPPSPDRDVSPPHVNYAPALSESPRPEMDPGFHQ